MKTRILYLLPAVIALASCAQQQQPSPVAPGSAMDAQQMSPECRAARLKPVDPMPVSTIPEAILRKAQSGWVAVNYDVIDGKARNLRVVSSNPPGLYDAFVLRHVAAYAEPSGATVRGCLTTTNIRF